MSSTLSLPLLPLRDVVVFPYMVIPLFVGREESINSLQIAMEEKEQVFLLSQKDEEQDNPKQEDLYSIGCVATILQLLRLPDGTVKVLIEGCSRGKLLKLVEKDDYCLVDVAIIEDEDEEADEATKALMRSVLAQFESFVKAEKKLPDELIASMKKIVKPGRLADNIMAHLPVSLEDRQQVLSIINSVERLEFLHEVLVKEIDLIEVEGRIRNRVKSSVEKTQRQYYLTEKMKAIQKELGDIENNSSVDEIEQFSVKIKEAGMSEEAEEKALSELNRLKMMPAMSAEATVCRNYLEWLLDVPWTKLAKVSEDLAEAELILENDHFGLEKVKERILEYLAVQQRVRKLKGPILCLVGPPGVGKTSLGQSIANATGREFARISLGGMRDEAEIRGHRRTYIGAMPGKIIQKMAKSGVRNPLFMLDEIDKMAMDFRGDPASALLEVLDPEQNSAFNDYYLEVDYDLSDVMFITTANSMNIPSPLLDRMEIIRLAGYTELEKLNIATRYLVPRQIEQSGLKKGEIKFAEGALQEIIRYYTREAGVRKLEQSIAKVCRKVVKDILLNPKKTSYHITKRSIEKYLGIKRYRFGLVEEKNQIGQVIGLAWTEVGGELLTIEAQIMSGQGKSQFTGSLGDVMQESIRAAMTVVRSRLNFLDLPEDFFQKNDFHVHVPEGATPKDGPSAGIGMCTALISAITRIPVKAGVAMTGEITLRGEVLPIGGLKEKLLAALRGGIKTVLIPYENRAELKEMPEAVKQSLDIKPVKWMGQVLSIALEHAPESLLNGESSKIKTISGLSPTAIKKPKKKDDTKRTH